LWKRNTKVNNKLLTLFYLGKEEKKGKEAKQQPKKEGAVEEGDPVSKLDFRVGKIVEIGPHPDPEATHLFCEKIDIGNGEIRNVASGLRDKVPIENLRDAHVIVLCNLKARNLKGFSSHGMVLLLTLHYLYR